MSHVTDRYRTLLEVFKPHEMANDRTKEYGIIVLFTFIGCIGCSFVFDSRTPTYEEDGIGADASSDSSTETEEAIDSDASSETDATEAQDSGIEDSGIVNPLDAVEEKDSGVVASLDAEPERDSETDSNYNTEPDASECQSDSDCPKTTPICNVRNRCVECESNYHCADELGCRDYECVEYTPACGNGILDIELEEQCDDGNNEPGDGCDPECRAVECEIPPDCTPFNLYACTCPSNTEWCVSNQLDEPDHRAGCMKMCMTDEDCPSFSICQNRACTIPCGSIVPNGCPPGLSCREIHVESFDEPGRILIVSGCGV